MKNKILFILLVLQIFVFTNSFSQSVSIKYIYPDTTKPYALLPKKSTFSLEFTASGSNIGIFQLYYYEPTKSYPMVLQNILVTRTGNYKIDINTGVLPNGLVKFALAGNSGEIPGTQTVWVNNYQLGNNSYNLCNPSSSSGSLAYIKGEALNVSFVAPDTVNNSVISIFKNNKYIPLDTIPNSGGKLNTFTINTSNFLKDSTFGVYVSNLKNTNYAAVSNVMYFLKIPEIKLNATSPTNKVFYYDQSNIFIPVLSTEAATKSFKYYISYNNGKTFSQTFSRNFKAGKDSFDIKPLLTQTSDSMIIRFEDNFNGKTIYSYSNRLSVKVLPYNLAFQMSQNAQYAVNQEIPVVIDYKDAQSGQLYLDYSIDGGISYKALNLLGSNNNTITLSKGLNTYKVLIPVISNNVMLRVTRLNYFNNYSLNERIIATSTMFKTYTPFSITGFVKNSKYFVGQTISYSVLNTGNGYVSEKGYSSSFAGENFSYSSSSYTFMNGENIFTTLLKEPKSKNVLKFDGINKYNNTINLAVSDSFEVVAPSFLMSAPQKNYKSTNKSLIPIDIVNKEAIDFNTSSYSFWLVSIGGSKTSLKTKQTTIAGNKTTSVVFDLNNVPQGSYTINVSGLYSSTFFAKSDTFSVVPGNITATTNKKTYLTSEDVNINFSASGISAVKFYYSADKGVTWNGISSVVFTSVNTFNWTSGSRTNIEGDIIIKISDANSSNALLTENNVYRAVKISAPIEYSYKFEPFSSNSVPVNSKVKYRITRSGNFSSKPANYTLWAKKLDNNNLLIEKRLKIDTNNVGFDSLYLYEVSNKTILYIKYQKDSLSNDDMILASSETINVFKPKQKPLIFWEPTNANFKEILTSNHLNAVSDKPGNFKYFSNIQGEIKLNDKLKEGSHVLKAVLFPTDNITFDTASSVIFYKQILDYDTLSFTDNNFRSALLWQGIDANNDGVIQKSEATNVTKLILSFKGIKNLQGIELFSNLDSLVVSNNLLSDINLSSLNQLRYLIANTNKITNLTYASFANARGASNFSNSKLQGIYLKENLLQSLDLRNLNALQTLEATANPSLKLVCINPAQNTTLFKLDNMSVISSNCSNILLNVEEIELRVNKTPAKAINFYGQEIPLDKLENQRCYIIIYEDGTREKIIKE